MPGRKRTSAETTTQSTGRNYTIPGIDFDEPLSWRAGKAIAVADLLERLQRLQGELANYEEDDVDRAAFATLGSDLASGNLLGHKDKGVRAWTVACVVDLLQICAPDAPFTGSQLKDIFTVIISHIVPALSDPSNAYNTQHFYVLKSLTEYKSICLLSDIDNAEPLIESLITHCFDIVSGTSKRSDDLQVSKTVEFHLNNLIAILIEEIDVSQDVIDIILSQFLRIDSVSTPSKSSKKKTQHQDDKQGNLLMKEYPPAYNMAKSVCTVCTERMLSLVGQYFSTIITDASSSIDTSEPPSEKHKNGEDGVELDTDEHADLTKAHKLIRELWRACPDVLANVIPQIEAELSSGNGSLRLLATQTVGDLAAGIGIAGIPAQAPLDPSMYPLPSIDDQRPIPSINPLIAPRSAKPFAAVYSSAYTNFLGRRQDRSPSVRAAWANAASRILSTSAGGATLSEQDQKSLLAGLAQLLVDPEDKVRLATIQSISLFDYHGVINCLGVAGSTLENGSFLQNLSDRCSDKRKNVRDGAIEVLARIWGVASADIERGNEKVTTLLAEIPSKVFSTYYLNDPEIHVMLDKVIHEYLIPTSFPPTKVQITRTESQKHRAKDKEMDSQEGPAFDADAVRVRRILVLVRSLDAKARPVLFAMQNRQIQLAKAMDVFLKMCEKYNGGVMEENEDSIKADMSKYVDFFAKSFPESAVASADLWKFAKSHDRRNYQLIRFATSPQSDYRTVTKAIKELSKRIGGGPASSQSLMNTLTPLLYRVSLLMYNRSNVPAITSIAHSDEAGLADAANEVLKEISSRCPEVLKSHILDLCNELASNAPSASHSEDASAADSLKACSSFARKYASDIPTDSHFLTALTHYAVFSTSPRAAKHAVSVVLAVSDKKDYYAKDILQKCLKDCKASSSQFLARLAAIAQICLLASKVVPLESKKIARLAVADILKGSTLPPASDLDAIDRSTTAKELALRILVNRCRSEDPEANPAEFKGVAGTVLAILMQLITSGGELSASSDTPDSQRSSLKLAAAKATLKLCRHQKRCEEMITPAMFIGIATIVLNPPNEVRVGFTAQLKKYLGQNKLHTRWFTILFLLAFEPDEDLRHSTATWLKSRVQYYTRLQQQAKSQGKASTHTVLEGVFARLLSMLAHHPDYPEQGTESFNVDLADFAKYICFYLSAVATEDNLSLIFHIAQRVKQTRDAIDDTEGINDRLYVLSDLAQATIRNWADVIGPQTAHSRGTNLLQTWPGKVTLPTSLFKALPNHEIAQKIAEQNFVPEEVSEGLEKLVRAYVKAGKGGYAQSGKRTTIANTDKKRRSVADGDSDDDGEGSRPSKKAKRSTTLPVRKTATTKTPKQKRHSSELPSSEVPSRKSSRVTSASVRANYAEADSDEDDLAMKEEDTGASGPVSTSKRVADSSPSATKSSTFTGSSKKRGNLRHDTPMENDSQTTNGLKDEDKENEDTIEAKRNDDDDDDPQQDDEHENINAVDDEDDKEDGDQLRNGSPLKEKGNSVTASGKKASGKSGSKQSASPSVKTTPAKTSTRATRSTRA